eukprot:7983961-Heterocapsa_arctica.AAC.1
MKRIEQLIQDETGYLRDKIKDGFDGTMGLKTEAAADAAEEEEEEQGTGAMENNMTKQEEAEVLKRLENNPEMKEAAKAEYDKDLLTETRRICNNNIHLGGMIFDNLIGGPNAQRNN